MILYPAIDLYDGKVVRLRQGDFQQATVYFDDPVDAARKWVEEGGAQWLHVVDLNGAKQGRPVNLKPIEAIMTTFNVPVQIGGGIRDEATAEILLTLGAGRVVIGSAALEDPDLLQVLSVKFPDRVALGIDARDGKVAVHGWTETTTRDALELAREFESMAPACLIYTDIGRDGMLTGPNFEAMQKMVDAVNTPVLASGGIHTLDELQRLKAIGCQGAILGRALYEGKIDLKEARAAVA